MIQSLATSQHWDEMVKSRKECAGQDSRVFKKRLKVTLSVLSSVFHSISCCAIR